MRCLSVGEPGGCGEHVSTIKFEVFSWYFIVFNGIFYRYFDVFWLICMPFFNGSGHVGAGHRHSSKAMGSPGSDRFDGGAGACGACGG